MCGLALRNVLLTLNVDSTVVFDCVKCIEKYESALKSANYETCYKVVFIFSNIRFSNGLQTAMNVWAAHRDFTALGNSEAIGDVAAPYICLINTGDTPVKCEDIVRFKIDKV